MAEGKVNKVKVVLVSLSLIGLSVGGYFLYKHFFPSKDSGKDTDPDVDKDTDTGSGSGAGTSYAPASSWIPESFPLKKGMQGDNIAKMQSVLGIGDDGKFGSQTSAALQKKGYGLSITKAQFDIIVGNSAGYQAPTPPFPPTPVSNKVYIKGDTVVVYSYPSTSAAYIVGRIKKSTLLDQSIGVLQSDAGNGFAKVKANAAGYNVSGASKLFSGMFFFRKVELSDKPY